MKLIDFIKNIQYIKPEAIIFLSDMKNYNSDIIISFAEENDGGIKEESDQKYHYLIEVFLAKEFIEDWEASLDYKPTVEETAKRLYDYAVNDA